MIIYLTAGSQLAVKSEYPSGEKLAVEYEQHLANTYKFSGEPDRCEGAILSEKGSR